MIEYDMDDVYEVEPYTLEQFIGEGCPFYIPLLEQENLIET